MFVLVVLLFAYILFALLIFALAGAAIPDKHTKIVFAVLGVIMPLLFVWGYVVSLFRPGGYVRFSEDFGRVEDQIEANRVTLFGGPAAHPSFSSIWQKSYHRALEKAAQQTAQASKRIVEFGGHFSTGRA